VWNNNSIRVGVGSVLCTILLLSIYLAQATLDSECTDENLFKWARRRGALTENVELGDFAFEQHTAPETSWIRRIRKRRGLMAAKALRRGDVIVSVPEDLLFSPQAANRTELQEVIAKVPELDSFAILALFLLQETAKGARSEYWPYLCKMPKTFQSTPFWPSSQVLAYGNTSNLYLQTRRLHAALWQEYNKFIPLLTHLFPSHVNEHTHSFARWVWAKMCIFSRNWGVSDPSREPEHKNRVMAEPWRGHVAYGLWSNVMVPIADMLNHDNYDESNIAWLYSSDGTMCGLILLRLARLHMLLHY